MKTEKQNLGELYAARAMAEPELPLSIPKTHEPRNMVYGGTVSSLANEHNDGNAVQPFRNKKKHQRKFSPFTIILILLGGAVASVLYIGNILSVGRLMGQINQLQTKHQQILNGQEMLKAQINRLSGLDRIQQLAHDQLGLQKPAQLPVWMEIDPERVKQVEEVIQQRMDRKR